MSAHIGLYFPYFHFPDDSWVKISALYWDKMYRIVPGHYETRRDTDLVKVLSNKEDASSSFVSNLHPEAHHNDLSEIGIQFIKLIENHTDELVKYYGIEKRDMWQVNEYTARSSPDSDTRLAYIYNAKIHYELGGVLESRGLGTSRLSNAQGGDWIGMHPRLANVYMSALAEKLASQAQAHPVTDDTINYFAVTGFTFDRLAQVLLNKSKVIKASPTMEELEARLATIAVKAVMPKDIDKVSIDQILKLREKYSGQFGKFQDFIQKTIEQLPFLENMPGEEYVNLHLEAEYKKSVKPKIEELDEILNSIGIETIPTILNMEVKVPALLGSGALLAGAFTLNPILGSTAAVAMGLAKIIGDKRKLIREEIKKSDVAYLMNIRNDLTPKSSLEWLDIQAGKLLFGT